MGELTFGWGEMTLSWGETTLSWGETTWGETDQGRNDRNSKWPGQKVLSSIEMQASKGQIMCLTSFG